MVAEHFDAAPAVLIFTTSLNSCGCLYGHVCMLPSHDPLLFIRLIISQNQAVWARAAGNDWVKSAVDVTSCTIHVQTEREYRYLYSFWLHYSSEYEYIIRTTIRHWSEYEANIRYIPTFDTTHNTDRLHVVLL